MGNNKINKKDFIWAMIGIIVGILVSYGIFTSSLKQVTNDLENEVETESTEEDTENHEHNHDGDDIVTTYAYEHTELTTAEIESVKSKVLSRTDNIRKSNVFMQVQTSAETYESYFYNSNNECYIATSDGSYDVVFMNDNKVVKYENASGALAVGDDIDILSIIENIVSSIKANDNINIYYYPIEEERDFSEYRIDLVGEDAVKMAYSNLGEDFAEIMMKNIKAQDESWDPHLVLVLYIPDDDSNTDFGATVLTIYDNETEYLSWNMLGWIEIDEWRLEDWWYTYDFSKTDSEEFVEHMQSLTSNLSDLLNKASEEMVEDEENTEGQDEQDTQDVQNTEGQDEQESTSADDTLEDLEEDEEESKTDSTEAKATNQPEVDKAEETTSTVSKPKRLEINQ